MPGSFTTPTISATIAEGGSLTVTITLSSALGAATTVRWVIVPKGKTPISSSDFSSLTGTLSFTSGSSTAQTLTLTPTNDTALEVGETFELQLYEVVSGSDDIELATGMVTISDNDTGSFGSRDRIGSGAKNVLGAASSEGADYMDGVPFWPLSGFAGGTLNCSLAIKEKWKRYICREMVSPEGFEPSTH